MKKRLFFEKFFTDTFLGKNRIEWRKNLARNNLGKKPKIFLSKFDKFLQKKLFDAKISSENNPLDT